MKPISEVKPIKVIDDRLPRSVSIVIDIMNTHSYEIQSFIKQS